MIKGASKNQNSVYQSGRNARDHHSNKSPPGHLSWEDRHWWLAGWNDRDIEIDGPETAPKPTRRKPT